MSLVTAHFLVNNQTGKEVFVKDLPSNYQFAPHERLINRQVTQAEYDLFLSDKYKNIKVYRYADIQITDRTTPPKGLDYKTGLVTRLFEDPFVSSIGFLERMDFYGSSAYNPTLKAWIPSDKIISETYMYTIDPATKYVVARTKVVSWFREDGTEHPDKKYMFKPYTMLEMEEEAIRRRSNVVSAVKIELAKFANYIVVAQFPNPATRPDSNEIAKAIAAPFNTPLRSYIDAGDKATIKKLVNASTEPFFNYTIPWFGKTVKEFILSRIS